MQYEATMHYLQEAAAEEQYEIIVWTTTCSLRQTTFNLCAIVGHTHVHTNFKQEDKTNKALYTHHSIYLIDCCIEWISRLST